MTLDNEQQREFLLEMMNQCQFPGRILDAAHAMKSAIMMAPIVEPSPQADFLSAQDGQTE